MRASGFTPALSHTYGIQFTPGKQNVSEQTEYDHILGLILILQVSCLRTFSLIRLSLSLTREQDGPFYS